MPPVSGPLSPSPTRLWSWLVAIGRTGSPSTMTMKLASSPVRESPLTPRAPTKREVRAEVTMIVSKGNNPLKFSPDVGFALSQLLAPQGRGFMPPQEAMRDAYDDLRAHQFGFMAGMRAALAGVLKRFEPEALEQRVVARSLLDNLLPGSRKARLWDLFAQMYGGISQGAEDDFHALFGREFLRAYEEQVERLQAEREPDR